ncbi:esterase/lipase family protein [Rhodococcus gannanensis]|uniref:Esterase/lipase family protein n=1 Tax=Rhodococcus gannanensis TaxID=1960308 RepID=A0ABW4PBM8_9NOCA
MTNRFLPIRALTVAVAVAALVLPGEATAGAAAPAPANPCVLLVHDIGRDASSWRTAVDLLERQGRCAVPVTWGVPADGEVPLPTAGLRGADAGADDLADAITRAGDGPFDVVAHGAGSLVAQRYLQRFGSSSVRSLTTLGPLWHGTEIGGLAATEDLSRALGTYDLVLAWEKPIVDPVCAGCRELIRGSDLLRDLHRGGVPTPGVRYTDIATPCDELAPPTGLPGARLVLDHCVSHFALTDDLAALGYAVS